MLPVQSLLSAFAKLQKKTTISFVMSACLCVRVEQFGFHWNNFHDIMYFFNFSKICRENLSVIKI